MLREAFLSCRLLEVVPDLISRLLVLFSKVSLVKAFLVLDLHVDWVVHQALILHGHWQLLHLVFSVDQCLLISLMQERLLFVVIVVVAVYWVEVVRFPVSLRCLRLENLIIGQQFLIVMLQILV